jgi:hypothetical protein
MNEVGSKVKYGFQNSYRFAKFKSLGGDVGINRAREIITEKFVEGHSKLLDQRNESKTHYRIKTNKSEQYNTQSQQVFEE